MSKRFCFPAFPNESDLFSQLSTQRASPLITLPSRTWAASPFRGSAQTRGKILSEITIAHNEIIAFLNAVQVRGGSSINIYGNRAPRHF